MYDRTKQKCVGSDQWRINLLICITRSITTTRTFTGQQNRKWSSTGKIANHVVTNIGQWKRDLEQEAAAVEHSNVYLALASENSQHRNLTFALVTICDYLCLPKFQRGRCRVFHAEWQKYSDVIYFHNDKLKQHHKWASEYHLFTTISKVLDLEIYIQCWVKLNTPITFIWEKLGQLWKYNINAIKKKSRHHPNKPANQILNSPGIFWLTGL